MGKAAAVHASHVEADSRNTSETPGVVASRRAAEAIDLPQPAKGRN